MVAAAAICAALSVHALRRRRQHRTAVPLSLMLAAAAVWALFYGLEFGASGLPLMRLTSVAQYFGIATISVLWLVFAARYAGRDRWITRRRILLLLMVPVGTIVLVATNDLHLLYYATVSVGVADGRTFLVLDPGPLYWLHVVYSYLCLLSGLALLLRVLFETSGIERLRVSYFLTGTALVFAVNIAYVMGFKPFGFLDLTPAAFTAAGAMLTVGIFSANIFDVEPIALDFLFASVPEAVLVVDEQGAILSSNPSARTLLARISAADAASPGEQSVRESAGALVAIDGAEGDVLLEGRTYHVTSRPLPVRGGHRTARLVVMRDITHRKDAEAALRRSKELYQSLVDSIPGATYRRALDDCWTMMYVSAGIETITGYPASDFSDNTVRRFVSVVHPDDVPVASRSVDAALSSSRPWEIEYRVLHRDGSVRWVLDKGAAARGEGDAMLLHGIIMDVTQQKLDRVEVERSQRELRRLATHLQVVRDEERAAIAWELHDEISQALSAVKMDVARFSGAGSEDKASVLEQTVALLDETIARLRRLYSGLRPGMLEDLGLSSTIEWRTSEFSRESGIAARVTHLDDIGILEDDYLVALYRVFEEILQLDVRDSGATEVAVEVRHDNGRAVVRVLDNRPLTSGSPLEHRTSLLHAAMRERLRDHGGDIRANRDRNDWNVSEVSLPLVQPPERG